MANADRRNAINAYLQMVEHHSAFIDRSQESFNNIEDYMS